MAAATKTKEDMILDLLQETRDDVKTIRSNYATRSDLQTCRAHCNTVTGEVFSRFRVLETHKDTMEGIERARKEEQQQRDLEAQQGQRTNILAGAIITAVITLLATMGAVVINKFWS